MASARVRVPDAGHRRISEPASVEIRTNADFRLLPEHLQCRWARSTGKSRTTILGERDIRIVYDAPESIRAALERIGRTEDLQFSPNNRRLALAAFDRNSIAVIDVDIGVDRDDLKVALTALSELSSPHLRARTAWRSWTTRPSS